MYKRPKTAGCQVREHSLSLRTPMKASEKPSHCPGKCLVFAFVYYSPGSLTEGLRNTGLWPSPALFLLSVLRQSPTNLTQAGLEVTLEFSGKP